MKNQNNTIIGIQSQLETKRKSVSFDSYDLSVRQIIDMVDSGDIFVPPEYQRQFIWDPKRQSTLIESIFLGIPVPSLFMATNPDSKWEVVDGVQRLGSLCHFLGSPSLLSKVKRPSPLILSGLTKLDSLNKIDFEQLPKSIQLHFTTRPVRVTVLNDKSDLAVRFDLFERLNTGGVSLTEQEIRNCVYRGALNDDIKLIASDSNFKNVAKIASMKNSESTYEEITLRFFAYFNHYIEFDHLVKDFLNEYMNNNRNNPIPTKDKELFKQTMLTLCEAFPNGLTRGRATTPINLFEAIAVGTALATRMGKKITIEKLQHLANDEKLKKFTSAGSNQKKFVIGRIEHVRDEL